MARGTGPRTTAAAVVISVACAVAAPGCATSAPGPTIVLEAVTPDAEGEPAAVQLAQFAREVDRISAGSMSIELAYLAAGRDTPRFDQVTASMISSGDADLGWIPARTWDTEGVETLRALNAPFVITDERHFEAVLSDAPLRADLMAGLSEAGVVGIDLAPEGLRHPFAWDSPLRGPEDYAGVVIRSPESETVWATLESFGATPIQTAPNPDEHRGMESSYGSALAPYVTSNVTFFPKANVLVAAEQVRARLTDAQWNVLVRAAEGTRKWAFDTRPSDVAAALAFCQGGGIVVTASPEQVAGLEAAAKSVVDQLRRDERTRSLLDRIAALRSGALPVQTLTECPGVTADDRVQRGDELNGTYSFSATEEQLRAAGATGDAFVRDMAGDVTVAIDYPLWHVHHEGPHVIADPDWTGRLALSDGTLRFQWTETAEDWSSATVTLDDDGSLMFADHRDGSPDPRWLRVDQVWFDRWQRVSDATAPPAP